MLEGIWFVFDFEDHPYQQGCVLKMSKLSPEAEAIRRYGNLKPWQECSEMQFNAAAMEALKRGESFSFDWEGKVFVAHQGLVGELSKWAQRLNIKPGTIRKRMDQGWPVEQWLKPASAVSEHYNLSHEERMACRCIACVGYAQRHKERLQGKRPLKEDQLLRGHPDGVAEPHLWRMIDGKTYVFKYRRRYDTIKAWAERANVPYAKLYQRLLIQKLTIKEAMENP